MKKSKAIIVGGGIGGLASAIALDKIGLDCVVLERSPKICEAGSGIIIGSNGVNCLKELGVGNKFKEKAIPINKFHIQNYKGKVLSKIDVSDFSERFGATMSVIHRADLINILLHSINPEKISLNSEVQFFSADSKGVSVNLVSGKTIRGDFLIGADGLHSVIRKGLPNDRSPRYAGSTCWRGIVTMTYEGMDEGIGISGMGSSIQFGLLPIGKNKTYWYMDKIETSDASKKLKLESLKSAILKLPKNIRNIIDQTPSNSIIRTDIFDIAPKKNWGERNCTLLGDSAHAATPNLGQGASMALEDSVELAYSLLHNPNINQALRNFEKRRFKRTTDMIKMSRLVGKVYKWSHPVLARFRNLYISSTPWITKSLLKKYASYHVPSIMY